MGLSSGTKLGPYEITGALGAGGMGEVYKARDARLGREVALKVVPDAMSADPERRSRLEREAQLLASLNHTNIGALYGVEESAGSLALVMELVPGHTLAERIAQGPVPPEEAVPIARQIAEALEYAHERGIVHRDLKPANIKLTPDGGVKVLDFGLAKALEGESSGSSILSSPTLTAAATKMGVILGTAAYMSPEQAKGKTVDRRSDIWSFGCVLYELLTGKLAFGGETVTDTLAAVVRGEPDWVALPPQTPAGIRKLLERCLRKDVKSRLQAVGDARITLEEAESGTTEAGAAEKTAPRAMTKAARWGMAAPWLAAGLFALAALLVWHPWRAQPIERMVRLTADFGGDGRLYTDYGPAAVLSPDGTRTVYVVEDAKHNRQLFIRSMDQLQATAMAGTEGGRNPFFSPDGQWIGFFTSGKLKKVAVSGGAVVTLCDIQDDRGGTWGEDGTIVFASFTRTGLSQVSASGGAPTGFSQRQGNEVTHRWPQFLPGSKVVIYVSSDDGNNYENSDVIAQVVATGERKTLFHGGYAPHYHPGGYITFVHEGTLFVTRFDLKRLRFVGQPVPLIEHLAATFGNGGAQVSFSESGMAAYVGGSLMGDVFQVGWLGSDGKIAPLRKDPKTYWGLEFSPDGKSLALSAEEAGRQDIWVDDWQHNVVTRITFGSATNIYPTWTPDGQRITYSTDEAGGKFTISWRRADGAGAEQHLLESNRRFGPMSWRPDGKVLVFSQASPTGDYDLMWAPLEGNEQAGWKLGEVKPFLNSPAFEINPAFSPDGRWLAYRSNESGAPEIYVRPFPGPGGRWQISQGGGTLPSWPRSGHEIFYVTPDHKLMVVGYSASGDTFRPETPRPWSQVTLADRGPINPDYSVSPEGKRAAVLLDFGEDAQHQVTKVTYVFNFLDDVRRQLAPSGR